MQDKARFFAYSTWAVMISLAIIIFTSHFLHLVSQPGWMGYVILLAFGLLYMNLAYGAIKRFIRKVPAPTQLHFLLGFLIFLPPVCWIIIMEDNITTHELLLITVLVLACGLGTYFGNRAGIKTRYEYVQKLKKYKNQKKEEK